MPVFPQACQSFRRGCLPGDFFLLPGPVSARFLCQGSFQIFRFLHPRACESACTARALAPMSSKSSGLPRVTLGPAFLCACTSVPALSWGQYIDHLAAAPPTPLPLNLFCTWVLCLQTVSLDFPFCPHRASHETVQEHGTLMSGAAIGINWIDCSCRKEYRNTLQIIVWCLWLRRVA